MLNSVTDSTAGTSVTYTYDAKGRRTKEAQNFGSGNSSEIEYIYLLNDQPSVLTVKENGVNKLMQAFGYDELDRLYRIADVLSNTLLVSYTYDNAGNLTEATRANGVNTAYTYNESNLITQVINTQGVLNLSTYRYQYYLNGAQSQVSDNLGRTQNFTYDRAGRLSKEQDTDSNNAAVRDYTYDVYGNRTSMSADGVITNYTYDANNRLTQQQTGGVTLKYNYDNNGNLYSKLRSEVTETTGEPEGVELTQTSPYAEFYTYNVLGQLVKYTGSESAFYTYGADGKRASKTLNGTTTRFLWNGDSLAYESNGTKYYYGNGLIAIAPEGSANKNYYLYDGHGSVTQLTDASGATIADYRYDAFGNQLQAEQPAVYNPFRYSGEYTDSESGLIYLRARYYDPSIGRFISEDPVKDGMNWYVYCANDPVNNVDPTGLWDPETDSVLSPQAQIYLQYYTKQWNDAYQQYQSVTTETEKAEAQGNMDKAHENADKIRELDAAGQITGTVYQVTLFNQGMTNICWAYCQTMIENYQSGGGMTQQQADNRARQIAQSVHGVQNWNKGGWPTNSKDVVTNAQGQTTNLQIIKDFKDLSSALSKGPVYGYYSNDPTKPAYAHLIVITGTVSASGQPDLVTSNNPHGQSNIQTYSDFLIGYPGDTKGLSFKGIVRWR